MPTINLLAAERALARLDEALTDDRRRVRLCADAARREAMAQAKLDGVLVHQRDFLVATAGVDHVSLTVRSDTSYAIGLWHLARTMQDADHLFATPQPEPESAAPAAPRTLNQAA